MFLFNLLPKPQPQDEVPLVRPFGRVPRRSERKRGMNLAQTSENRTLRWLDQSLATLDRVFNRVRENDRQAAEEILQAQQFIETVKIMIMKGEKESNG